MNPCKNASLKRYSYEWSYNVVKKLVRKYARATGFLCAYLSIDLVDLANKLARGDSYWPRFRDCTHYLERWMVKSGEAEPARLIMGLCSYPDSSPGMEFGRFQADFEENDLTELREYLRLNSQGFRGYKGGRGTSRPSPGSTVRREMGL